MRQARGYQIREYLRPDDSSPYREWVGELPVAVRARISARLVRFQSGNLGDSKSLGDGLWEARFMFGPGYRLYFGLHGMRVVVLLGGGDKRSQRGDITRARQLWRDFEEANNET